MMFSGAAQAITSTALPAELSGVNLVAAGDVKIPVVNRSTKGTVVVFLSARCPCSNSHVSELKELAEKYKDFKFVGIHSNVDEDLELSKKYFAALDLPFAVIQDDKASLADSFKALKTPHAYVLSPQGEIVFQGGITDSASGKEAHIHHLAAALEDLQQDRKIKTAQVRTLGCVILREKNTW